MESRMHAHGNTTSRPSPRKWLQNRFFCDFEHFVGDFFVITANWIVLAKNPQIFLQMANLPPKCKSQPVFHCFRQVCAKFQWIFAADAWFLLFGASGRPDTGFGLISCDLWTILAHFEGKRLNPEFQEQRKSKKMHSGANFSSFSVHFHGFWGKVLNLRLWEQQKVLHSPSFGQI